MRMSSPISVTFVVVGIGVADRGSSDFSGRSFAQLDLIQRGHTVSGADLPGVNGVIAELVVFEETVLIAE